MNDKKDKIKAVLTTLQTGVQDAFIAALKLLTDMDDEPRKDAPANAAEQPQTDETPHNDNPPEMPLNDAQTRVMDEHGEVADFEKRLAAALKILSEKGVK